MTMEWDNISDRFNLNGGNSRESFEEHNESMREFRRSHTNIALINRPRLDKATFLESLLFLRINSVTETGGSALPNEAIDQPSLGLMQKVARYKLSQN